MDNLPHISLTDFGCLLFNFRIMKRIIFSVACTVLATAFYGQAEEKSNSENVQICVKHRVDEGSVQCYESNGFTNELEYLKNGIINYPREYSVNMPTDCMIAKIRFVSYKNGVEIDKREHAFSKSTAPQAFTYKDNALMGPYMKPRGEDEVKIYVTAYRKTSDGFVKMPSDETTYTVRLNQDASLLAENK